MTHISFSSLFRKNNMGGKTDWVGKKLTSQIFPRGKKLTDRSVFSPGKKLTGEKTDRYTGTIGHNFFSLKSASPVYKGDQMLISMRNLA